LKSEGPSPENIGDGEAAVSCSGHRNLGCAHCRAGAERLESVCPSFNARFSDAGVSICLHSITVYGTSLLYIVNGYPQTIPNNLPC
jgi:hypothetical protein